jgi:hypothetical protein
MDHEYTPTHFISSDKWPSVDIYSYGGFRWTDKIVSEGTVYGQDAFATVSGALFYKDSNYNVGNKAFWAVFTKSA